MHPYPSARVHRAPCIFSVTHVVPSTAPTAVGAQASGIGARTSVPHLSLLTHLSVWHLFESVVLGQGATFMMAKEISAERFAMLCRPAPGKIR